MTDLDHDLIDDLFVGVRDLTTLPRVAFTRKLHLVRKGHALCGRWIAEIDTYASHSGWSTWRECPADRCLKCAERFERERSG